MAEILCVKCGSANVESSIFQESAGSTTVTKSKSKYKEKGHGCLWWLLIGWWWWAVDLLLWIFFFVPRLIIKLVAAPFKKKKYKGSSTSVSATVNDIHYATICLCKDCGHNWKHVPVAAQAAASPPQTSPDNAANRFSK